MAKKDESEYYAVFHSRSEGMKVTIDFRAIDSHNAIRKAQEFHIKYLTSNYRMTELHKK